MANTYGGDNAGAADPAGATDGDDYESKIEQKADAECVKRYWSEIERYERVTRKWYEKADKIVTRYLDEQHEENAERRFALLWANIETLRPSYYARLPTALCERRFRDRDPVGRVAAEIMERCTNTALDIGAVDEIFRQVRDDRLLAGRGTAWVRYDAKFETVQSTVIDFRTGQPTQASHDRLTSEKVVPEYVYWKYFGHNLSRTWSGVWLVWRICHYQKYDVIEKFGKQIADKLKYTVKRQSSDLDDIEGACAEIYEVWDSRKGLMSCISKGWDDKDNPTLDSGPPPIKFNRFFPCPEPVYATKSSKSLTGVTPDYEYYRDQAKDIDDLTAKISNLVDWLRVKAFYPRGPSGGGGDAVEQAITDTGNDDIFIQVSSWAEWVEKGGAKGLIDWLPLDMIVAALNQAINARNQLIQDVYQITGISDILRGQTDPDETFGAQNIKNSTGSRRLRNGKDDMARFCEDVCKLMAEAAAENFQPETFAQMSGFLYTPGQPTVTAAGQAPQVAPGPATAQALPPPAPSPPMSPAGGGIPQPGVQAIGANGGPPLQPEAPEAPMNFGDDVVELLRNDQMRTFRIKVETDSTTQPDDDQEKQRRVEFLNVVAGYLEKAVTALQMTPDLAPAVKEILMFTARGFRVGRNMESTIEDAIEKIAAAARQPKPENKIDMVNQAKLEQSREQHQQKMEQSDKQFQETMVQSDQQHRQKMQQADQQFAQQLAFEREKRDKEIAVENHRANLQRADKASEELTVRSKEIADRDAAHEIVREGLGQHAAVQRHEQTNSEVQNALAGFAGGLDGLAKQIAAIMDEMGAPVEVMRDKNTGKVIGAKRGGRSIAVNRNDGGTMQ